MMGFLFGLSAGFLVGFVVGVAVMVRSVIMPKDDEIADFKFAVQFWRSEADAAQKRVEVLERESR